MARRASTHPGAAPASDLLQRQAFPELAQALRSQISPILREWKKVVRQVLPELTSRLSPIELQDSLPDILGAIAEALASDDREGARRLMERSPVQGITRFQQHYDVRELVIEDRLLRRVVVERVAQALRRRATVAEEIALHMGLDIMLQQSVVAFVTHQNQQLRSAAEAELQYLAYLSHDLRGNLGNVTLWLQALKLDLSSSPQSSEALETLDTAQQAILDTMGGMGRLLQAERLRHQGTVPKPGPLNLRETVAAVARQLAPHAEHKGLRVSVDVPSDAVAQADRELVTLVLQNLVGNAIKYSARGTVRIRAERQTNGKARGWSLFVADDGPGIAPNRLENIFDAFRRGEAHGQGGMGLGLTIASRAAKLLNAKLTVESRLGVGSTFRLAFPPEPSGTSGDGSHSTQAQLL